MNWKRNSKRVIGFFGYLLFQVKQGVIYLRSGRKPVLIVRLPRHTNQRDHLASVQSISGDEKLQRDYFTLVTVGTSNNELEAALYSAKDVKPAELEDLKRELNLHIVRGEAERQQRRMELNRLKGGNIHRR